MFKVIVGIESCRQGYAKDKARITTGMQAPICKFRHRHDALDGVDLGSSSVSTFDQRLLWATKLTFGLECGRQSILEFYYCTMTL